MADETLSTTAPVTKERASTHPGPIIAKVTEVVCIFVAYIIIYNFNYLESFRPLGESRAKILLFYILVELSTKKGSIIIFYVFQSFENIVQVQIFCRCK